MFLNILHCMRVKLRRVQTRFAFVFRAKTVSWPIRLVSNLLVRIVASKRYFISSIYRWRNLHWVVGHARGFFKESLELHVTSSDAELIVKFIGRRG